MSRKPRLEFEGAEYHVIGRGKEDTRQHMELMQCYTRGWALASKEYKQALLKDHHELEAVFGSASGEEYQLMREALWENIVERYLRDDNLTEEAIRDANRLSPGSFETNPLRF